MEGNFFDAMEDIDAEWFRFFNARTGWFNSLERCGQYSRHDFEAVDIRGRKCAIELKTRNFSYGEHETIFIEPGKYQHLKEMSENGYKALYINFLENYRNVLVFDMDKVDVRRTQVRIFNPGFNEYQQVERLEIPRGQGHYYVFNTRKEKYTNYKWEG